MIRTMVKVPGPLLLEPTLAESAKLLWMVEQVHAPDTSPLRLATHSGLAPQTVQRGLARPASAGWTPGAQARPGRCATVPSALLADDRLGIRSKVLYGTLQLTPGSRRGGGQLTYAQVSQMTGASVNALKRAVRVLRDAGWLELTQATKFSPIRFLLSDPVAQRREEEVAGALRRLERAEFFGEALMREYLSLIVASEEYEDNATPGFLVNPFTGEELQLDRYYSPTVAFEYNGPQHYGPTARYPDAAEALKQQCRDQIKAVVCAARGITLVVLHPEDLCREAIQHQGAPSAPAAPPGRPRAAAAATGPGEPQLPQPGLVEPASRARVNGVATPGRAAAAGSTRRR